MDIIETTPIRLTRTPALALAGLLRSLDTQRHSGVEVLSSLSGVQRRDIAAIVRREHLVTAADASDLAALATAAGVSASSLSYGAAGQVSRMADDEDHDEDEDKPAGVARYRFVLSTADVDRASDIVGQSWRLDAFRANPVAPFGHRADMPPIGAWEEVGLSGGRLTGILAAHPIASYPLSVTVAEQLSRGLLRTVSVGFLPGEAIPRSAFDESDPRFAYRGVFFDKNELLECSVVTVPMNAAALAEPPPAMETGKGASDTGDRQHDDPTADPDPWAWLHAEPEHMPAVLF